MTQRKFNQGEKLHRTLRSDEHEFRRHLANTEGNFQKHLGVRKSGFQFDGSFNGYQE